MNSASTTTNTVWTAFTGSAFVLAAGMMAGGIYFLEASFSAKGFYAMAAIMLVYTSVGITKAVRDMEESKSLTTKLEDARAERLLMETQSSDML